MREVPWEKSKGRQKCSTMEKLFNKKPFHCFKLSANDLLLLKLMGPSAFIPVMNFDWTINYLCITINYELCIAKYSRVVRLFIDANII